MLDFIEYVVAELKSKRLSKTTGQVISVDGGLADAFLR